MSGNGAKPERMKSEEQLRCEAVLKISKYMEEDDAQQVNISELIDGMEEYFYFSFP